MGRAEDTWTDGQVETFRQMWAAGFPLKTIAHQTGKTVSAAKTKRRNLGLPSRDRGEDVNLRVAVSESLLIWLRAKAAREGRSIVGFVHHLLAEEYQKEACRDRA